MHDLQFMAMSRATPRDTVPAGTRAGPAARERRRRGGAAVLAAALASIALVVFAACDDFYADAEEPTPGPTATAAPAGPAPEVMLPPEELAVKAAREAVAATLDIDPAAPSLERIEGATWTDSAPGCYPVPTDLPRFLIPGIRVSLTHEGTRYEYHSDLAGTTGGLCEGTPQPIGALDAKDVVRTADVPSLAGEVVVLRTADEAALFLEQSPGVAEILVDEIEWEDDDLVGTALGGPGCDAAARVTGASWDGSAGRVTVTVEVATTGTCGTEALVPVWVLLDATPPDTEVRFEAIPVGEIVVPTPERVPFLQRTPGPAGR